MVFILAAAPGRAEISAKFVGAESCSSSSCHGGGGVKQNQYLMWSLKDFHSQRPPATLATARSRQIADALAIKNPVTDSRCTVCHAPLNEVPDTDRGEYFKVSEGVSCESCHGPAEKWIRSHTRTDYSHADRAMSGMRDLQNLYVRANTCVACHQFVSQSLLTAGHPALIFELDSQCVSEPKHWQEATNWNGAQAWLVGAPTVLAVLLAISFSHLLNDTIQALIPSLYPLLKDGLHLSYSQLGLITLTFQCTASLLQPLVGMYTDRRPLPANQPAPAHRGSAPRFEW